MPAPLRRRIAQSAVSPSRSRPLDQFGNTFLHDQFDSNDPDPLNPLNSGNQLLVMDFQDFDESVDDQLGGEFFRGAFLGVGQLLGYGYADHLPQPVTQSTQSVLNPGATTNRRSQVLRTSSTVSTCSDRKATTLIFIDSRSADPAAVDIQTVAQRLRSASSLDTALRLYQRVGSKLAGDRSERRLLQR